MRKQIPAFLVFLAAASWVYGQIEITGTVAMADGTVPAAPVKVLLKCNNSVVQSVYTGPEGRFRFSMAERTDATGPGVTPTARSGGFDASIGGTPRAADIDARGQTGNINFRRTDLSHCHCEAELAGYESATIRLGVRSRFDNPDIGMIGLYPIGSVKGTTVSVTTASAPKKAMKAFEKAKKEASKEKVKVSNVIKELEKSVDAYPEFAEAWQFLGETYLLEGRESEAKDAFRHAIEADPQYIAPYANLGELELRANNIEEAARLTGRAIELNPFSIGSHYFHAVAQYYLGDLDKAEESIRKVQQSSQAASFPMSHRLLGGIYSERGKYSAAAEEFDRFLATNPPERDAEEVRKILEEWRAAGVI
jgi:hypothetical protein